MSADIEGSFTKEAIRELLVKLLYGIIEGYDVFWFLYELDYNHSNAIFRFRERLFFLDQKHVAILKYVMPRMNSL